MILTRILGLQKYQDKGDALRESNLSRIQQTVKKMKEFRELFAKTDITVKPNGVLKKTT